MRGITAKLLLSCAARPSFWLRPAAPLPTCSRPEIWLPNAGPGNLRRAARADKVE